MPTPTTPVLGRAATLLVAALVAVAACTEPVPEDSSKLGEEDGEAAVVADQLAASDPEESWLTRQPRMAELRASTPAEMGWAPGSTPWSTSRRTIPADLSAEGVNREHGPTSPGEAMTALAHALGYLEGLHGEGRQEIAVRVGPAEESGGENGASVTGVLLYWGAPDDSIAGSDLRATLRSMDGRWYIDALEQRFHCRRGVTDGLCL
jgi:hypothetical protein